MDPKHLTEAGRPSSIMLPYTHHMLLGMPRTSEWPAAKVAGRPREIWRNSAVE